MKQWGAQVFDDFLINQIHLGVTVARTRSVCFVLCVWQADLGVTVVRTRVVCAMCCVCGRLT